MCWIFSLKCVNNPFDLKPIFTDDKIKTANGIESTSVSKINGAGTTNDEENILPDSSEQPQCGPSSSSRSVQNGVLRTGLCANGDSDDDDSEDGEFQSPK